MFWKAIAKGAVKVAVFAVGHKELILETVADAKAKNLVSVISDVKQIVDTAKGN